MSYGLRKETFINELNCPKCNDTCVPPRQLPCGNSLCTLCLEVTEIEAPNRFKCMVCEQIHFIPEEGFPIDEKLANELNKKAALLKVNSDQFKSNFDSVKAKLKQVEFLANGDYVVITEFCRDLKTDVQLAKELKIKELEETSEDTMAKKLGINKLENLAEKVMSQIDIFQKEKLQTLLNNKDKAGFELFGLLMIVTHCILMKQRQTSVLTQQEWLKQYASKVLKFKNWSSLSGLRFLFYLIAFFMFEK